MNLTRKEKASYGVGAIGKDMVYTLVSGFLLYYYNQVLGIKGSFIAVIFMLARVFDAFNDPFMGIVVEKTRSRYGKFRPWLLIGTMLNAVVLVSMYSVPRNLSHVSLLVYTSVMYVLWGITYTVMDIPYWSMLPAITKAGKEREDMSVIARSCAGVGAAISTAFTMLFVKHVGGDIRTGFTIFAVIIAVFFVVSEIICVHNIKEHASEETKSVSVREMFGALFQNDQALIVVISIILFNASLYLTQQLTLYFFEFDIGKPEFYGVFGVVGGGAQILAMMLLPLIRKRFQCKEILKGAIGLAILGYACLFVLGSCKVKNVIILCSVAIIVFIGFGLETVLTTIFLADTVDYGEWKDGKRNEGVIFSLQTFVVKLASAVSVLIAGIGIDIIGLDKNASTQTASTLLGLRILMIVIPVAGLLGSVVFFTRKYKLDESMLEKISLDLKGRKVQHD